MSQFPVSSIALGILGLLCSIVGGLSLAGYGAIIHPLFDDDMAGLACLVSAVALFGSAGFPLVIARLRASDTAG